MKVLDHGHIELVDSMPSVPLMRLVVTETGTGSLKVDPRWSAEWVIQPLAPCTVKIFKEAL